MFYRVYYLPESDSSILTLRKTKDLSLTNTERLLEAVNVGEVRLSLNFPSAFGNSMLSAWAVAEVAAVPDRVSPPFFNMEVVVLLVVGGVADLIVLVGEPGGGLSVRCCFKSFGLNMTSSECEPRSINWMSENCIGVDSWFLRSNIRSANEPRRGSKFITAY